MTNTEQYTWNSRVSEKTTLTTVAGAIVTILVWVAGIMGLAIPAEVSAALVTIIMAVAAYALPVRKSNAG